MLPSQDLTLVAKIEDVKTCAKDAGLNLNDGATITVTYTAHLNEKAAVNTAGGASNAENKNSVRLQLFQQSQTRRRILGLHSQLALPKAKSVCTPTS